MDTGCNRIILIDKNDIVDYQDAIDSFLRTAQADAQLVIAGRGKIGDCSVLHIPTATANLMSSRSIVINRCRIELGQYAEGDELYCCIYCNIGHERNNDRGTFLQRSVVDHENTNARYFAAVWVYR